MAIIGKNLLTTPRWPDGNEPNNWQAYLEDRAGVPTGYNLHPQGNPVTGGEGWRVYLTGNTNNGMLGLPVGELQAGDTYYIWLWMRGGHSSGDAIGRPFELGLLPMMTGAYDGVLPRDQYATSVWPELMKKTEGGASSDFQAVESTVTIPDMSGVTVDNAYGDPVQTYVSNEGIQWVLALRNTAAGINLTSIGGARLDRVNDYDETPPVGYADGGMGELYSWEGTPFESITLIDDGVIGPTVIEPPVPMFSIEPPEYTLPETTGAAWLVNAEPAEPGTYAVEPTEDGVTVSIIPEPMDGYAFEPPAELQQHTWKLAPEPDPEPDPEPEPEPDPDPADGWEWPETITPGGELVARWLKWTSDQEKLQASFYYDVARAYVWGYTRGRGFDDAMQPTMPLQRVIVSGAARIAYNPESVVRWQISNESEMATVFNGFNLAEQAILNRYRKRFA